MENLGIWLDKICYQATFKNMSRMLLGRKMAYGLIKYVFKRLDKILFQEYSPIEKVRPDQKSKSVTESQLESKPKSSWLHINRVNTCFIFSYLFLKIKLSKKKDLVFNSLGPSFKKMIMTLIVPILSWLPKTQLGGVAKVTFKIYEEEKNSLEL